MNSIQFATAPAPAPQPVTPADKHGFEPFDYTERS